MNIKNEELNALLELSRNEDIRNNQSNLKCKKFCDLIFRLKNKLIFWRKK